MTSRALVLQILAIPTISHQIRTILNHIHDLRDSAIKTTSRAAPTIRMTTVQQSPLLSLPPELRIIIYDCVFETLPQAYRDTKNFKTLEPTALFQVCRLMRAEVTPRHQQWVLANATAVLHDAIPTVQTPVGGAPSTPAQLMSSLDNIFASARNDVMRLQADEQAMILEDRAAERYLRQWEEALRASFLEAIK